MTVAWHRAREPLTVLAIALFTGVLSTSQRWAGLDTPDSSFYASPRPVRQRGHRPRAVRHLLLDPARRHRPGPRPHRAAGTWPGFAVYRLLLLLMLVAARSTSPLRRFTGIASAAFLALITSPEHRRARATSATPTSPARCWPARRCCIACAMFDGRWAAAIAGVTLGWLVMVHPAGRAARRHHLAGRCGSRPAPASYLAIAAGSDRADLRRVLRSSAARVPGAWTGSRAYVDSERPPAALGLRQPRCRSGCRTSP